MQNEEQEPDPVKYHISQLKQLTKQYPASRILWQELFRVLFQQGSGYTASHVRTCCVDAVRALSKHAERTRVAASSTSIAASDRGGACSELWQSECAALEALSRHMEFEFCSGHISAAVKLLRCACEWFSCPRESCVILMALSTLQLDLYQESVHLSSSCTTRISFYDHSMLLSMRNTPPEVLKDD
jgi:hypothetical protein